MGTGLAGQKAVSRYKFCIVTTAAWKAGNLYCNTPRCIVIGGKGMRLGLCRDTARGAPVTRRPAPKTRQAQAMI